MWKAIKPRLDDKLLKAGSNDANSSNVATNEDVEMITVKNELQDDWEDTNEKKRCSIQTFKLLMNASNLWAKIPIYTKQNIHTDTNTNHLWPQNFWNLIK